MGERNEMPPTERLADYEQRYRELAAELAALAGHAGTLHCLERPHGGYAQYAIFHRGVAG